MHLQSATREEHEEEEEGEQQNQKSQFPKSLYFRQLPFARNWFLFLFLSVFSFPTSSHFSARAKEEVVSSSTGTYVYMVWYGIPRIRRIITMENKWNSLVKRTSDPLELSDFAQRRDELAQ